MKMLAVVWRHVGNFFQQMGTRNCRILSACYPIAAHSKLLFMWFLVLLLLLLLLLLFH